MMVRSLIARLAPLLLVVAVACGGKPSPPADTRPIAEVTPPPAEAGDDGAAADPTPDEADDGTVPGTPSGDGVPSTDVLPDGAPCVTGAMCASGVCEGEGCGPDALGTCAPADRMCTMDLFPFCGCDGETFMASSSCPGRRYRAKGPCEELPVDDAPRPEGAACLTGSECASGVCEGQGCGDDSPGRCAPERRPCTRDLALFCGCDGTEFRSSSSCPGRRYEVKGACPQPVITK